ncbi:MAG: FAD-dependent oxidoreductase, partial [Gammaproteobacteria bacterium]
MADMINRLPQGGRIDRDKPIRFTFNGRGYTGYAGDTLASALLANDVRLVGRSFKYHRPRGILSAGTEEPNALVQLEEGAHTLPNVRATEIELYEGLSASSQNCWPSVEFDVSAINSKLSRLFPAGFYYKTFMWPKALWMKYEEVIRNAAGLGKCPMEWDPSRYMHQHVYTDVLVVGAGPAGLSAALAAARAGCEVMLIDEQASPGGDLSTDAQTIDGKPGMEWVEAAINELQANERVRVLPRTTVTGYFEHNYLIANERVTNHLGPKADTNIPRERLWKIRAREVVLATGSIERPLVFADNDRPGVMLAGAVRRYINEYGVLPGKRLVIQANNDSAYGLAVDASKAGAEVTVIDTREAVSDAINALASEHGFKIRLNSAITAVNYGKRIQGVEVAEMNGMGDGLAGQPQRLTADLVATAGGWAPTLHLYSQAGGKLGYNESIHGFLPREDQVLKPHARIAGSAGGEFALVDCLRAGHEAGAAAAEACGGKATGDAPVADADAQLVCTDQRPL